MKRVIKRIYIFALAFLLTVFTVSISTNVNASDLNQITSKNDIVNNTEQFLSEVAEKSKISDVFEVESLREENVKHFRLEDGTYRAISYDRPVHIKDENGNWQEIDNTLALNEETYKTKDNRIILSKNISSEPFLKQTNDDYSIQWSIVGDRNSTGEDAVVTNYKELEENKKIDLNDEMYKIQNSSKVYYTNIYDNVNLEYYLEGNTVITKLKLDTLENCDISFILNVDNLDIKIENGCLMFYNLKKGNLEYKLLAPYMIYENGINSNDINYTLQKIKDGEYKVTLSVDLSSYNTINSKGGETRLIPNIGPEIVIVDGGGGGGSGNSVVYDTYVSSSNPTTNYGSSPEVKVSSGNSEVGYFKLYEPNIPDGSTIVDSFMLIPYYFTTTSSKYINVGAYQIMENWSEYSVDYNDNISISSTRLSNAYVHATATIDDVSYVTLGIVEAAKSWYDRSSTNRGIAVKYENGTESNVNFKSWESHEETTTLTVDYSMDALIVDEDTYFIKNGHLDKYIQIDDGDSENDYNTQNAILEIWEGTGVSFQKWEFEYLHNGYYKIESYRSGKVIAVKEGNENSSNDALVQQTYNGSYRQQWKITITSSGKYKIKPRSSESYDTDWVMCIGEGIGGNGRNVEQRSYSNNSTYKDEWIILKEQTKYTMVFNYYDAGYYTYYGETSTASQQKLNEYMETISDRYLSLLDFNVLYVPAEYYHSPIDICKGTVTTSNINTLCTHSGTIHTERNNVITAFKDNFPEINNCTHIYWTEHRITSTATNGDINLNRSCSSEYTIMMLERSSSSDRDLESTGVLMHELNHQYGARDHYHELADSYDPTSCKFGDICSSCGTSPRPSSCIMNDSRIDITLSTVICSECKREMEDYIDDNYD